MATAQNESAVISGVSGLSRHI